jgi:GH24 family phage-related lysozyme (muramidase)
MSLSEQCSICNSDWLYKAPKGIHTLCQECYGDMNKDVVAYHTLQEDAHKDVQKGNIEKAIQKLKQVQVKRNELSKYFKNTLNTGHSRFANEFIPNLMNKLEHAKKQEATKIWDEEFKKLAEYEE